MKLSISFHSTPSHVGYFAFCYSKVVLLISQKLGADFEALKDMLGMMENRAMMKSLHTLQKLAETPPAPLLNEAERQLALRTTRKALRRGRLELDQRVQTGR